MLKLDPVNDGTDFLHVSVCYLFVPCFVILTAPIPMNENASKRLLQIRY